MAYAIEVENNQSDGRQIKVYHDHHDSEECIDKVCVIDGTGTGSKKEFSLDSVDDYLTIQFVQQGPPDNPTRKDYQYYIELPDKAFYHFTPNGDYTSGGHRGISVVRELVKGRYRTRLRIPQGQVPAWSLTVIRPIGAGNIHPPNDNVTVSEDAH